MRRPLEPATLADVTKPGTGSVRFTEVSVSRSAGHSNWMHLLVKNGTLVTAADTYKADIEVDGERIVRIGENLDPSDDVRVIDATDRYVLPGGVDPHTHLDTPSQGTTTADDYLTGTIAAACGGTTTIVNFCFQEKGKGLNEILDPQRRPARRSVVAHVAHAARRASRSRARARARRRWRRAAARGSRTRRG